MRSVLVVTISSHTILLASSSSSPEGTAQPKAGPCILVTRQGALVDREVYCLVSKNAALPRPVSEGESVQEPLLPLSRDTLLSVPAALLTHTLHVQTRDRHQLFTMEHGAPLRSSCVGRIPRCGQAHAQWAKRCFVSSIGCCAKAGARTERRVTERGCHLGQVPLPQFPTCQSAIHPHGLLQTPRRTGT